MVDRKGWIICGCVFYNINNMWWVIVGGELYNELSKLFYVCLFENFWIKCNVCDVCKCLECELFIVVEWMDYFCVYWLKVIIFGKELSYMIFVCDK